MTKMCIKCGKEKPATTKFFPKNSNNRDGLRGACTVCFKAQTKKWREENQSYHKEWREKNPTYHKEWREKNPSYHREWLEAHSEYNKSKAMESREYFNRKWREWTQNNPDYYKSMQAAEKKARRYVKKNAITKLHCQICGGPKVEMHHHDYEKPLDIVFACRTCHKRIHSGLIECPKPINLESLVRQKIL